MNNPQNESISPTEWIPRILIAVAILLLVYFTLVTYQFKGTYDDSFLAQENLELIRGPLANEDYFRMGELNYTGKDPFEDAAPADVGTPSVTPGTSIPMTMSTESEPEQP